MVRPEGQLGNGVVTQPYERDELLIGPAKGPFGSNSISKPSLSYCSTGKAVLEARWKPGMVMLWLAAGGLLLIARHVANDVGGGE